MISSDGIKHLLEKVEELAERAITAERTHGYLLDTVHPRNMASARNLLHYLAIRSFDLRALQYELSDLAISSHSHSEAYTLNNLQKIGRLLKALIGLEFANDEIDPLDSNASNQILKKNSSDLLGPVSFAGQTKIMVTLPGEVANDYALILQLLNEGMHIARINTAHDNADLWERIIQNCRKAAGVTGLPLKVYMDLEGPKMRTGALKTVLPLPDGTQRKPFITLHKGGYLKISKTDIVGHEGDPPVISLSVPEIFDYVKAGESIWFDDGKLGGTILSVGNESMLVEIDQAPVFGFKLKEERGVNFPISKLPFAAFTKKDKELLPFIARNAEMVGLSFVQTTEDIDLLQQELKALHKEDIGIILKIETNRAFNDLPSLLFKVMQSPSAGIMIARGDLAVELGLLRMAEVQEEILWIADAAHLPVIWATQILETQAKKGMPTRAEISDAVKATRAECAMLNKGPHIIDALKTLKDIDERMAMHEQKKLKMLRALSIAKKFLE